MKLLTIAELKGRASEVFSSIIVFCPNFPPAAQTNAAKKFEQLNGIIDRALEMVRCDDARQWLRICLEEIEQSRKHYEEGDRKKGMDLIQRAEQHFKQAFATKGKAVRFVAGPSGPALDSDSGFPQ
jgi:hypothetical protein